MMLLAQSTGGHGQPALRSPPTSNGGTLLLSRRRRESVFTLTDRRQCSDYSGIIPAVLHVGSSTTLVLSSLKNARLRAESVEHGAGPLTRRRCGLDGSCPKLDNELITAETCVLNSISWETDHVSMEEGTIR
jgi:hypothetical protein